MDDAPPLNIDTYPHCGISAYAIDIIAKQLRATFKDDMPTFSFTYQDYRFTVGPAIPTKEETDR